MGNFVKYFRLFVIAHHFYICYKCLGLNFSLVENPEFKVYEKYGGRYFSGWNILFQMVYFGLAYLESHQFSKSHRTNFGEILKTFCDFVFMSLIVPSTFFVCSMFWFLMAIDRELVFPAEFDVIVSSSLNHSIHTFPFVYVLVELLVVKMKPINIKSAVIFFTFVYIVYYIVLFFTYFNDGVWLYKIYRALNWSQKVSYVTFNYLYSVFLLKLGFLLQTNIGVRKNPVKTL